MALPMDKPGQKARIEYAERAPLTGSVAQERCYCGTSDPAFPHVHTLGDHGVTLPRPHRARLEAKRARA